MSSTLFSRFSLHIFITILIILQIVCNTSQAYDDFPIVLNHHDNKVENETGILFDTFGQAPVYDGDGHFAKGSIDLGGLLVHESLYFKKIWDVQSDGPKGTGVSFYEPSSLPEGYNLLGHFGKINNVYTIATFLIARDITRYQKSTLKSPIDYTLIWTSKGLDMAKQQDGYIWLPIPPNGYKTVGHIVTTSSEKPALDKVRCVRSDLTDSTQADIFIWGYAKGDSSHVVNFYTTKPISRERSVPVGTFWTKNSLSTHELPCLKMVKKYPYYAMPTHFQIRTMMSAYAPWVYFHPDEEYFPSSASWFFQNGAELHQRGQVPEHVRGNGENLPNNVAPENAYLEISHIVSLTKTGQSMGTCLVRPLMFQLGPFAIDLGIIGEHVGDWEHITLRVDNYRGVLKAVYLSQHAKGKWVRPREFELMNGTRPVVYSSLHSHSHYSTPTYYLHSASKLESSDILKLNDVYHRMNNSGKSVYVKGGKYFGFGARDDAAKSNNVMDIASHYDLVSVEYMEEVWNHG
ncbi:hypothetical protein At1g04090-like [Bidens hawaiensis]|uniref:hypothetical protein At1g04090-like n=1 Tax=Bidens hawaiensis TaxID=980011 RepID=UPI00404B311E